MIKISKFQNYGGGLNQIKLWSRELIPKIKVAKSHKIELHCFFRDALQSAIYLFIYQKIALFIKLCSFLFFSDLNCSDHLLFLLRPWIERNFQQKQLCHDKARFILKGGISCIHSKFLKLLISPSKVLDIIFILLNFKNSQFFLL